MRVGVTLGGPCRRTLRSRLHSNRLAPGRCQGQASIGSTSLALDQPSHLSAARYVPRRPESRDRPTRILHVEANEDGTVGGSHRALVDLASNMNRTRFEPVVLFFQTNRHVAPLREAGIEVHCWDEVRTRECERRARGGSRKYLDFFGAILRRAALIRTLRIDMIHLNNSLQTGYDDWLPAARLTGVPCITFAMGDAVIGSRLAVIAARRFDHVIAISAYMRDAVRAAGVREDRITLAYLGVDAPTLRSSVRSPRALKRAEMGIAASDVAVIMVGNVRAWKGQHVLVEALALLPPDVRAPLQIRFVGAGSAVDQAYRDALDARIAAIGATGCVRFLGGRDDVPELYAAADIAVHASVIPEPFGLVVPEAMAHGLPVIASRFGGPGEVVTPACGRLFDPAHPEEMAGHLTELVRDASLRRSLGDEARRQVEAFSVREMVDRIELAYTTVLSRW